MSEIPASNNGILRDVRVGFGLSLRHASALLGLTAVQLGSFERGELPLEDKEVLGMIFLLTLPNRTKAAANMKRLQNTFKKILKDFPENGQLTKEERDWL